MDFQRYLVYTLWALLGLIGLIGGCLAFLKRSEVELMEKQLKIQTEAHVNALLSTYQANIQNCEASAREAEKDEAFIEENCIEPINASPIAKWLDEWGYSHLLVEGGVVAE